MTTLIIVGIILSIALFVLFSLLFLVVDMKNEVSGRNEYLTHTNIAIGGGLA